MMPQVQFKPLGRQVSCLGLGCARLDGRIELRRSMRLLETALDLGINYFDVAESYGTAEEALGHVLGNSRDVVVATKVGPAAQPYNPVKIFVKSAVRPIFDRARHMKVLFGKSRAPLSPDNRPRYDFSRTRIERSIEASRKRLRRDFIDVYLAHEPHRLDLNPEIESHFQSLVDRKLIGSYGVGIGAPEDRWAPFGSIWQSGWPGQRISESAGAMHDTRIFHGVLRLANQDRARDSQLAPAELIRAARRAAPDCVLLVSASTPERLRELAEAADVAQ